MICEICKKAHYCDEHHITSRKYGGSNKPSNIATICPNCHRLVHKGLVILEGRFMSLPKGIILVWRKYNQESITGVKDPKVYIMSDENRNLPG
jgi:hypothetical protein